MTGLGSKPVRLGTSISFPVYPQEETFIRGVGDPISSSRPSIAVLPFANLSGDPEQEYFADGIVEEIITALLVSESTGVECTD
jgi:TolB-like protein